MPKLRYLKLWTVALIAVLALLGLTPAGAASANISHSYSSAEPIQNGSLVSLDQGRSDYVLAANTDNSQRLIGIAVAKNDSLLAVDPGNDTIQVATSGSANALVSTLNGSIAVGDQISVSPFDGVGMKATPGSRIVGLAQTSFNAQSPGATTQQVTNKQGKVNQIAIGFVRLGINPGTATVQSTANSDTSGIQRLVKTLTGHTVSNLRAIISLVVALVAIITIISMMYASIYGSIISIGRNPLAKYAVFRSLSSILSMALLTAVIAGATIFFLLH